MAFNAQYQFKVNNTVVIQMRGQGGAGNFNQGGTHIRVKPNALHQVDHNGGKGDFAQFHAELLQGGNQVMFKSLKTGKYLRIKADHDIDVGGAGGAFCHFRVHHANNHVKLEAVKTKKWLAYNVQKHNGLFAGGGGEWCKFKVFKKNGGGGGGGGGHGHGGGGGQHHGGGGGQHHGGGGGGFQNPFEFKVSNDVVIQHRHNNNFQNFKSLRVDGGALHKGGGRGEFARFRAEKHGQHFKFKSLKTGKYIRITQENHQVDCNGAGGPWTEFKVHKGQNNGVAKLQSVKTGKYVAANDAKGVFAGGGGDHCKLRFFRRN